jgi:hypothetical protein
MPLFNTASGPVKYPDEKSMYPAFPRVSFGQAVAIGLSAGIVGAIRYILDKRLLKLRIFQLC